jgi:glycosyltransferase involved in cell wall biosynthesis
MPELPEVETTVRGLKSRVLNRTFVDIWTDFPKMIKKPKDFKDFKEDAILNEYYDIKKNELIILSLGRITKMKGFQNIIKLIPKLKKQNLSIKYLIAGNDDGYKQELIKLIKKLNLIKNVIFVGFLNHEEKKQYINECDIFAIPSLWEPFGLVALEGMLFNKVIISTEIGGLKEVLKNYNKKINLKDKNLFKLLESKKKLQGNFDSNIYNWENISKLYLDLMKK